LVALQDVTNYNSSKGKGVAALSGTVEASDSAHTKSAHRRVNISL
jgi:hypothetical protein